MIPAPPAPSPPRPAAVADLPALALTALALTLAALALACDGSGLPLPPGTDLGADTPDTRPDLVPDALGDMVASDLADSDRGDTDADDLRDASPDTDARLSDTDTRLSDADADEVLTAIAGPSIYALVGETVVLDGSASRGAVAYAWFFGNGERWDVPRSTAAGTVAYDAPGRYRAVLTVYDALGNRRSDDLLVTVTHPPVFTPRAAGSVWRWNEAGVERVAAVSTDGGTLTIARRDTDVFSLERRVAVCDHPRTVTDWSGLLVIACPESDELVVASNTALAPQRHTLDYGARPSAALGVGDALFVALAGDGAVVRLERGDDGLVETGRWPVLDDPRGLAALPGGRLAISRWRSPDAEGQLATLDPSTGEVVVVPLAIDPQRSSDTESGGLPSYLDVIAVAPTGLELALPSLQANIIEGDYVNGVPLTHQTTLRAIVSFFDLPAPPSAPSEDFERRFLFDDRGLASAAVYSSRGDYLFVTTRGHRTVERLDVLTGASSGTILDIGFAPQGIALSADDRYAYVDAALSRQLVVFDVSDIAGSVAPVARIPLVDVEPLAPAVLRGAQLFNDSLDTRLAQDGYIACAHCHLDGESDNRTWDFTNRGEGMRNTTELRGRAGLAHGPLHWSANFDEVQDFEHDIRGPFRGTGLMADADYLSGGRDEPLGAAKAGWSADLDALAAYVSSLRTYPRSPFRTADGALTADALAGRALFEREDLACASCHTGPHLTDSALVAPQTPRLHDVGTLGPGSGGRLGGALPGIDTPTLHGLWNTAPYLHDGSAATLAEVLGARNASDLHGVTSGLSDAERDQLIAYLLSLDGPRE